MIASWDFEEMVDLAGKVLDGNADEHDKRRGVRVTKVYIVLVMFGGIPQDIALCRTTEEADETFKRIVGVSLEELYPEDEDGIDYCAEEKWDCSMIYVQELPDWLEVKGESEG